MLTIENGEEILKNGDADIIAYGRSLLCDPDIAIKAANDADPYLHCKNVQEQRKIPDFDKRVVDDKCELRAEKKTDKSFRRKLVELATYEADFALKSYLKVGECA